jgi:hypothetical protein
MNTRNIDKIREISLNIENVKCKTTYPAWATKKAKGKVGNRLFK